MPDRPKKPNTFKAPSGVLGKEVVELYLQRAWNASDGLPEADIRAAERRLAIRLPSGLVAFYRALGGVAEICSTHHVILHPKDLSIEDSHLLFMEENQSVVSWGIKLGDLHQPDPPVWQRNNTDMKWHAEQKSFTELLTSLFEWYMEMGVWSNAAPN